MWIFVIILSLLLGRGTSGAERDQRPNIIFILADDLGYGDLGSYGQTNFATPRLDQMAQEGMRFKSAYAGSTVCAPSRCVLMTGLHTGHARIRGNARVPLQDQDVTVAEVLKKGGYKTALVGKWGLGDEATSGSPIRQGFDYYFGYLDQVHAHNYYPTNLWRNDEIVPLPENSKEARKTYTHDLFTEEAFKWVRENQSNKFFLYLAYTIPHANNERKLEGMEVPDYGEYKDKDWSDSMKGTAAMISRMDRDVGRLLDLLKQLKLDQQTLVIFSSDNGPHKESGRKPELFQSSGPLRGIKRDLYEGGIRVPTIAWWPGQIRAGENDYPCGFWDFLPTAAELANVPLTTATDGISLVPLFAGREVPPLRTFYWEFHEGGTKQAARRGKWKAVRLHPDQPLELYDLENDLGETKNVAAENLEVVRQFEEYLKSARTPSDHWPIKAPPLKAADNLEL